MAYDRLCFPDKREAFLGVFFQQQPAVQVRASAARTVTARLSPAGLKSGFKLCMRNYLLSRLSRLC